jgi:hypothetical protein
MDNGQTRMLSGIRSIDTILGHDDIPPHALEAAKSNLASMPCFGLSENFDESLLLFQKSFGWRNITYRSVNRAPRQAARSEISDEVRRVIAQYNALDMELYEYGQKLFAERLQKHQIDAADLQAFRRRNVVASRFYDIKATVRGTLLHSLSDAAAILAINEISGLQL